jgi:hypothetical protein
MAKLVFGLNQSLDGYVDHKVTKWRERRWSAPQSGILPFTKAAACVCCVTQRARNRTAALPWHLHCRGAFVAD